MRKESTTWRQSRCTPGRRKCCCSGFDEPAGRGETPPRQPAAAAQENLHGEQQPEQQLEQQPEQQQQNAQQFAPWLGKAAKLDAVGKLILSHYEHNIVSDRTRCMADAAWLH